MSTAARKARKREVQLHLDWGQPHPVSQFQRTPKTRTSPYRAKRQESPGKPLDRRAIEYIAERAKELWA